MCFLVPLIQFLVEVAFAKCRLYPDVSHFFTLFSSALLFAIHLDFSDYEGELIKHMVVYLVNCISASEWALIVLKVFPNDLFNLIISHKLASYYVQLLLQEH